MIFFFKPYASNLILISIFFFHSFKFTSAVTINLLKKNFGFAGREFVARIEEMGFAAVDVIKNKYFEYIKQIAEEQGCEKEDKQILPMALILTADEIAEEFLFRDGVRLDAKKCVSYLKNKGEVSEHKRAYEYILSWAVSNGFHFADSKDAQLDSNVEQFGFWEAAEGDPLKREKVVIFSTVFEKMMKSAGYQSRAFLSWADRQGLLETGNDNHRKKLIWKGNAPIRCVVLRIESLENSGIEDDLDEELPFD